MNRALARLTLTTFHTTFKASKGHNTFIASERLKIQAKHHKKPYPSSEHAMFSFSHEIKPLLIKEKTGKIGRSVTHRVQRSLVSSALA
jgi:hypothetical protein